MRLTRYDIGRDIYVLPPDAPEGVSAIQTLGRFEDRDQPKRSKVPFKDLLICGACEREVAEDYTFCPDCGQRLKEEESDRGRDQSHS